MFGYSLHNDVHSNVFVLPSTSYKSVYNDVISL